MRANNQRWWELSVTKKTFFQHKKQTLFSDDERPVNLIVNVKGGGNELLVPLLLVSSYDWFFFKGPFAD